tara:strand:+ start:1862 stop:2845 length:984 start_codon:yes stop_codon:yes gene_type:complete
MTYSFFGTCSNDYFEFFECLKSILNQSLLPKEIILVNSGENNIKKDIQFRIKDLPIKLIYIHIYLPRVDALNLALDKSTSKYSFRFDTRSRFAKDYAKNAIQILNNKLIDAKVVGGVPRAISSGNSYEANLCSKVMSRNYTFFYPRHRRINFSGYSSSVYLGCFDTKLLKKIRFRENSKLISEDSQIIKDFKNNNYKTFISEKICVFYKCRSSFKNLLNLFNTYGYCRANTIIFTKEIFISKRHLIVLFSFLLIGLAFKNISLYFLFIFPFFIFLLNLSSELFFYKKKIELIIPFCSTLCQFSWICGFLWRLMTIFKYEQKDSNFIS